jgi:hypothetical protein
LSSAQSRQRIVDYSIAAGYPASMTWLYIQWYKPYQNSSFHFFNDNAEWEMVDKYAHVSAAYLIGKGIMRGYQWAGLDDRKALWRGATVSFAYLTTIEFFDAYSDEWGFSYGDVIANATGVGLLVGQQLMWNEQRVVLKGSFHSTKYPAYRPSLLGDGFPQTIVKDYNGQTWWASINPRSFMKADSRFPKWLSIAVGVGGEGMIGGHRNPEMVDGMPVPSFDRYSQYYFGIDFDVARIETSSKFLNGFFKAINIIRLPAPTVEFNSGHGNKFYWLYF